MRRQVGAEGAAAARLSLAFLAARGDGRRAADDAPARAGRGLPRADGRRHGAQRAHAATVRVDPRTHAVTLDGEPVSAPPVERVAFSDRFLLG